MYNRDQSHTNAVIAKAHEKEVAVLHEAQQSLDVFSNASV